MNHDHRLNNIRTVFFCSFACGLFILFSVQANAQDTVFEIDSGLWKMENSLTITDMNVNNHSVTTECLSGKQTRRSLHKIISEISGGEDNNCSVSNIVELPGEISMDIQCAADIGSAQVASSSHMQYKYSRTAYSGGASGVMTVQGRKLPFTGRGTATRIGDCATK